MKTAILLALVAGLGTCCYVSGAPVRKPNSMKATKSAPPTSKKKNDELRCPRPQNGSFNKRLKQAPYAFIGRISEVNERQVTFTVEKTLKGKYRATTIATFATNSPCGYSFKKNERWLFAGVRQQDPSLRIGMYMPPWPTDRFGMIAVAPMFEASNVLAIQEILRVPKPPYKPHSTQ